jgi:hypothetical protein
MSVQKQFIMTWVLIFSVILVFFVIKYIVEKLIKLGRKNIIVVEKNNLSFFEEYDYSYNYFSEKRMRPQYLHKILDSFKTKTNVDGLVTIESKFNNIHYAIFDLDSGDNLVLFRHLYQDTPYALFYSSADHYWGIIDLPFNNIKDIFYDTNWKVCNDQNYVSFSRRSELLLLRGVYETEDRKPKLHSTKGIFSKNFQLFIDKLCIYYNNEGLEFSVLRFKDPKMLIKFNRRRKLQQLKDIEK